MSAPIPPGAFEDAFSSPAGLLLDIADAMIAAGASEQDAAAFILSKLPRQPEPEPAPAAASIDDGVTRIERLLTALRERFKAGEVPDKR